MSRVLPIAVGLVCLLGSTTAVLADDAEDVAAAVRAVYKALNNGDAAGYAELIADGYVNFPRTGALLGGGGTAEEARSNINDRFRAGLDFSLQVHHVGVKVYGQAAIATYYTTGPTTYPDGSILQGTFRASLVWVKQGASWKIVHLHISELQPGALIDGR